MALRGFVCTDLFVVIVSIGHFPGAKSHLVDGPGKLVAFSELRPPEREFLSSKGKGGGFASIIKQHHQVNYYHYY